MSKKTNRFQQEHKIGDIRYLTYELLFPDGDSRRNQLPFVEDLSSYLKKTAWWATKPDLVRKLLKAGEGHFKDHNGVTHRIYITKDQLEINWGKTKKNPKSLIYKN